MKTILGIAAAMLFAACGEVLPQVAPVTEQAKPVVQPAQQSRPAEVQNVSYNLSIDGMMCEGCASRVKAILEGLPDVDSADVDLAHHQATVKVKAGKNFDESAAKNALDKDSYTLKACAVAS